MSAVQVSLDDGQPLTAVFRFLVAFKHSAFSLVFMEDENEKLLEVIKELENPEPANLEMTIKATFA